ncbi:MAG: helix-turn-helix domain-containing protein, partial [Candidatus Omnitrophica bacterium]|nr:helix-turn-helix domain-containing protein [Candidatus Omnitrophota bacterium]
MEQVYFPGWDNPHAIKIVESDGFKKVLIEGRTYFSWPCEDKALQRIAIVQLYESKLVKREDLARLFGIHKKVISRYLANFARDGLSGLISQQRGPKSSWKLKPRVRGKILLISLKQGVLEYKDIQKRLEDWGESVSIPSIRQVLLENGLVKEGVSDFDTPTEQRDFWDGTNQEAQLYLNFGLVNNREKEESENAVDDEKDCEITDAAYDFYPGFELKAKRHYSPAQRIYLNQLEWGDYNTYIGGLLFVPLLQQYSYLPTIKKLVKIKAYEGYTLDELCLTLFYFDAFDYRSMEDFKRAYPEEFGMLISRSCSPSLWTLRRFLHKVKEQQISEKLIDEFSLL